MKEGEKEVVSWERVDYSVGRQKNSPHLGNGGNIALSDHNNIKGEGFRYLLNLNQRMRSSFIWARNYTFTEYPEGAPWRTGYAFGGTSPRR